MCYVYIHAKIVIKIIMRYGYNYYIKYNFEDVRIGICSIRILLVSAKILYEIGVLFNRKPKSAYQLLIRA